MTTIWLPQDLVGILDELKDARRDPTRSDTVRFLILLGLSNLGFLDKKSVKALGLQKKEVKSDE